MCAVYVSECRVKEGLSRSEQLVGYFYSAPLLYVAYCLCDWRCVLRQTAASQVYIRTGCTSNLPKEALSYGPAPFKGLATTDQNNTNVI